MGLVLGAGFFSAHCQQIKVSGHIKMSCRQEEKVCEVVKKEQASAGAREFSVPGQCEKSWRRCAD